MTAQSKVWNFRKCQSQGRKKILSKKKIIQSRFWNHDDESLFLLTRRKQRLIEIVERMATKHNAADVCSQSKQLKNHRLILIQIHFLYDVWLKENELLWANDVIMRNTIPSTESTVNMSEKIVQLICLHWNRDRQEARASGAFEPFDTHFWHFYAACVRDFKSEIKSRTMRALIRSILRCCTHKSKPHARVWFLSTLSGSTANWKAELTFGRADYLARGSLKPGPLRPTRPT